jgi:hypothetical protein
VVGTDQRSDGTAGLDKCGVHSSSECAWQTLIFFGSSLRPSFSESGWLMVDTRPAQEASAISQFDLRVRVVFVIVISLARPDLL